LHVNTHERELLHLEPFRGPGGRIQRIHW
jgi:hypothetical protein